MIFLQNFLLLETHFFHTIGSFFIALLQKASELGINASAPASSSKRCHPWLFQRSKHDLIIICTKV